MDAKKSIVKVGYNRLQVVIALSGGELIHFEADMTGQLMEVEKHEMSGDVACLHIAPVPEGSQRSRFLALGSYDNLCVEGVVSVAGDALRIFMVDLLGKTFKETMVPPGYTPRKFVVQPKQKLLVIIETDHGAFTAEEREAIRKTPLSDEQYGYPKAESEKWVSYTRVLDPKTAATTCLLELLENEAAVRSGPKRIWWLRSHISIGFVDEGKSLELLHKTQVEGVCSLPVPRKTAGGHRTRTQILQSIHYCKYRPDENQLYILADDCVPRWLTASHHVDFAGEDKFGNVYFVRSPQDVSEEIEEDPTGGKIKWEQGKLNGAPNKADEIVQFHVGDVVTCLQKALMIPGRTESIMSILLSVGETTWLTDLHIFRSR
ncbi:unnamed protein product [Arabis nemorensis]|uniref:Uncharacterized protein n=1 Tax=Arabis nemorensis TaxID=586526 RepID=A0A565BVM9_9BRAS|nr:unnamed protein product [Arabis nemorensis]